MTVLGGRTHHGPLSAIVRYVTEYQARASRSESLVPQALDEGQSRLPQKGGSAEGIVRTKNIDGNNGDPVSQRELNESHALLQVQYFLPEFSKDLKTRIHCSGRPHGSESSVTRGSARAHAEHVDRYFIKEGGGEDQMAKVVLWD